MCVYERGLKHNIIASVVKELMTVDVTCSTAYILIKDAHARSEKVLILEKACIFQEIDEKCHVTSLKVRFYCEY